MKSSPWHASLLVLALFAAAAPVQAASATSGNMVVAQATGESGAGAQDLDAVRKFLAGGNNLSRLDADRLQKRLKRAERFKAMAGLPADLAAQLDQQIAAINAELANRQSAGQTGADSGAAADQSGGQPPQQQAGAAPGSGEADSFLQSAQPASGLNDQQLRQQMRKAAELSKSQGISAEQRRKLRDIVRAGRDEIQRRKTAGGDANANANANANASGNIGGAGQNGWQAGAGQQQGSGQPAGSAPVDQGAEQRARAILDANVDASKMSKQDLRKRLGDMRDLLQSNQLSPATRKALRQKLATERAILRGEVGQGSNAGAGQQQGSGAGDGSGPLNRDVVKVVIADRRPAAQLRDDELRRRIDVYRVIAFDASYSQSDRLRFRAILDQDRLVLRDRLLRGKREREARLRDRKNLNIDLSLDFRPDRPVPPRSVFAAEVDDQELTDVLAAPPRRKIDRRYTLEEVENSPGLRDAVARIEIDTVHFGFGESFLREEEIGKLDRIAEILERILAESPGEVFMIEGHTDAVGSDQANLQLSRERAKAVKEALATYYVIPEENLKTVGFGEKYLKIPTEEPEAENRRVSIARITPLVGELQ
jgi:outer membrane protein OmpA-like peptidoglycan-associated protein